MKITRSKIRSLIREEIEALEGVFSGGDNLELDIDHSKAVGSEEVTDSQEVISHKAEKDLPEVGPVTSEVEALPESLYLDIAQKVKKKILERRARNIIRKHLTKVKNDL